MHEANEEVVIKTPKIRCFVYRLDKSYIIAGLEGALFVTLFVPCSAIRFYQLGRVMRKGPGRHGT